VYLGLDLGTTNIKALLVTEHGATQAEGSHAVGLQHTQDGGVEQQMEEIWAATIAALRSTGTPADRAAVRAIGVSSQGGALQICDADGSCIGPVISWMDPRGRPYDEAFQKARGEAWLRNHIGHGESGIAIGQLLRLGETAPSRIAPPNRIGFVGDTTVRRLCGRAAHDGSSLSIACLYNPRTQQADSDVLDAVGVTAEQLPELRSPREPAGKLAAAVAKETNLPAGVPVGPAVHDQYAAALGCGALAPGDVLFGAGTAWVLVAVADSLMTPIEPSAWVCNHLVPGRWGQLLSLRVGGSAVQWALTLVGRPDAGPDEIDAMIESVPPGSDGVTVWPFFDATGGARRPNAGRVCHLRLGHGPAHLIRATVEGLCYELARQLGWLDAAGCPARRLIMCGGATASRCTPQLVADITGRSVVCPEQQEISAFGAAILARGMAAPDASLESLYHEMAGPVREHTPGPEAPAYATRVTAYAAAVDADLDAGENE
jgi:sugar (pentulose or hexulose) kinase